MKRFAVLALLLLAGCVRYETIPADALAAKWTWERCVHGSKEKTVTHVGPCCLDCWK